MTRRIIFYLAIIVFFAISYVVLLYAQGYKYSFSDRRFIRTGAIYLNVNTNAHVLLDGQMVQTTSFIANTASIDTLLPGTYTVGVQKEGYSVWQKKVTVMEGFVQDFSHVLILPQTDPDQENIRREIQNLLHPPIPSPTLPILSPTPSGLQNRGSSIPQSNSKSNLRGIGIKLLPNPSPTPDTTAPYFLNGKLLYVQGENGPTQIATNVTAVVRSDDGRKIAWIADKQIWVYWLSDTDYQPIHHAGDIILLSRSIYPVKALVWFKDSDHLALDADGLKIIEIDTRGGTNIINF